MQIAMKKKITKTILIVLAYIVCTGCFVYFSKNETAGLIVGAAAPVILTSRADSPRAKMLSIAAAVMMAHHAG